MKHLSLILSLFLFVGCAAQKKAQTSVSILGDSYSTFEGYLPPGHAVWYRLPADTTRTDVTSVKQTWWQRFISRNGCRLEVNNSYSGATICNTGYRKEDYSDRSFITRLRHLGSPDIIFVFGGTNDSWAGVPIGEYRYVNFDKESLYTFRPAMAYMLHGLRDYYPKARVYVLLNDGLSDAVTRSIEAVCAHYEMPCIRLEGIDKKSGHPSALGMEQICMQIEAFIKKQK